MIYRFSTSSYLSGLNCSQYPENKKKYPQRHLYEEARRWVATTRRPVPLSRQRFPISKDQGPSIGPHKPESFLKSGRRAGNFLSTGVGRHRLCLSVYLHSLV
jgi:hypothetical protein